MSRTRAKFPSRIAVIGSPGCGKSYLATRLAELTSLPLHRLDDLYWQENWVRTDADVWERRVRELAQRERWIIDGNYAPTLPARVWAADLIVFIDRPALPCLMTVLRRDLGWAMGRRAGLPVRVAAGTRRVPPPRDLARFLRLVATFRRRVRPEILALLTAQGAGPYVRLTRRTAVNAFLRNVTSDGFSGNGNPITVRP